MDTKIYIKLNYKILGKVTSNISSKGYNFVFKVKDKKPVEVSILPNQDLITAIQEVNISETLLEILNSKQRGFLPEIKEEIFQIKTDSSSAVKRVISLIKYTFHIFDLDERLVAGKDSEWSTDKSNWQLLPQFPYISFDSHINYSLNDETSNTIQEYLDNNFEPFLALKYIHKAKNENIPQHKWIDATIAAELAIKEFLIRLKPDIETLILEVPSPPLSKLYGTILESLRYPKSPKLKEIKNGIEKKKQINTPT